MQRTARQIRVGIWNALWLGHADPLTWTCPISLYFPSIEACWVELSCVVANAKSTGIKRLRQITVPTYRHWWCRDRRQIFWKDRLHLEVVSYFEKITTLTKGGVKIPKARNNFIVGKDWVAIAFASVYCHFTAQSWKRETEFFPSLPSRVCLHEGHPNGTHFSNKEAIREELTGPTNERITGWPSYSTSRSQRFDKKRDVQTL